MLNKKMIYLAFFVLIGAIIFSGCTKYADKDRKNPLDPGSPDYKAPVLEYRFEYKPSAANMKNGYIYITGGNNGAAGLLVSYHVITIGGIPYRSLIQFNGLENTELAQASMVTGATLVLACTNTTSPTWEQVKLSTLKISQSWDSSAPTFDWNTRATGFSWATPGGDIDLSTKVDVILTTYKGIHWLPLNNDMVLNWAKQPSNNFGVMIKREVDTGDSPTYNYQMIFCSKTSSYAPYLIIWYKK